ncbi:MAG: UDP-2,4-diacetamido-2,4,6-trideoxy-beta-L-altropyranose hydrolase [Methylococcaceae bacterium]|nr:UDP-2,4-diacetamido-2,4,6-trideoxy-beta-L-altropyranose hydrolase [Methylococcaceae bacterium]MDP3020411.1 UDP-2,4-diacetamido-2,4,6-trideoxy-beta-L-altropyranose hydrolase [Methylococcaceae bacterium]MDP3390896.1 UDP-2,4-diacetamido-2,4,6-trideoxy-beta-L-altropyranose hydrolase [Methylococcaceae bacterium]MDP3931323.1 UDP-2,4-diacetamido-2,4,6-trideoxy-beta-L-altropyranose hydrolase [Methylococcaceae bacterium]
MRCLTLAEVMRERGVQLSFICREHSGNLIALLRQKSMPFMALPDIDINDPSISDEYAQCLGVTQAEDAAQTIEIINGEQPDWLVVDHYALDVQWEQQVRPHINNLMVIDDLANRHHDCNLLLDQNYSPDGEQRYTDLVPTSCSTLLGPRYALLRQEFRLIREHLELRSYQLKRILVFFTAGDDQGETLKAMRGIELFGKAEHVDVVVGQSNPGNAEISQKCIELNWGYHCQVDYMSSLIAQADIVIGAGGASNWERCALGVPSFVAILAANQAPIAQALDRAGIVINLGWYTDLQAADYEDALNNLKYTHLARMSERALKLVDAKGAERVVEKLLAGQSINLDQARLNLSC